MFVICVNIINYICESEHIACDHITIIASDQPLPHNDHI